jgi:hypothetical protein
MGAVVGVHILLGAFVRDSVMRFVGHSLHNFSWDTLGGAHCVALEAMSEMIT